MQEKAKSLHYYFKVVMWVTIVVPIIFYSLYMASLEYHNYKEKELMKSQQTIANIEIFLTNFDNEIRNSLIMFTNNYALQMVKFSPNYEPLVNGSIQQFNQGRVYKDIAFGLSTGKMFTENIDILPAGYDPRTRPWYKIAVEHPGEIAVTDLYQDALDPERWTITYSKAVYNSISSDLIGVAGADVTLVKLGDMLKQNQMSSSSQLLVLDENNRIIVSTDENGQLKLSDGTEFTENLNTGTVKYKSELYLTNIKSIDFMHWKIILLTSQMDVYLSVLKTVMPVLIIAVVLLFFFNIMIKSIEPLVLKALDQIVDQIKSVGQGNYALAPKINSNAPREFAIIYNEVESMKSLLNTQTSQLLNQKNEINEQYQEINALYEETTAMNDSLNDLLNQIESSYSLTVEALSNAIEANDVYTKGHCERVRNYTVQIGEAIGLSGFQLKELEYAAILHDIGKVGIPSEILNKPSALTPKEYEIIKMHPEFGAKIINNVPYLTKSAEIILHHHEWYNGNGYPYQLMGHEVNIMSQIIGVADAYDAMTSRRSYRHQPLSQEIAIEQLELGKNTQFNGELVEVFIALLKNNPSL